MTIDFIIYTLVVFLVGVGVGTFVLGSRIRKVVAEAIVYVKAEEAKVVQKAKDAEAFIKKEF